LADDFRRPYDWIVQQMHLRGLFPSITGTSYPVWAYYHWNGIGYKKPDLRHTSLRRYAKNGPEVLMTIDIQPARLLLSDYEAWHWVLNQWHFSGTEEQTDFESRCTAQAAGYMRSIPLQVPALQKEMEATWQQIFDLERCAELLETASSARQVQAVFWELRPQDVRAAVGFSCKGKTQKLPIPGALSKDSLPSYATTPSHAIGRRQ
jgi:hypothetical protein